MRLRHFSVLSRTMTLKKSVRGSKHQIIIETRTFSNVQFFTGYHTSADDKKTKYFSVTRFWDEQSWDESEEGGCPQENEWYILDDEWDHYQV